MSSPQILKKIRNTFFSLLAFFLILLASISALVETETGSRWLITRIADLVGTELQGVRGNLREGLDIDVLTYNTGDQAYSAKKLSFRWRPVDLLYGALAIQSLRAQAVSIQPPSGQGKQQTSTPFSQWPHLRLPVRIHLQQARINNIELLQGGERQYWRRLSGSISWGTFHLRYNNLALVNDQYSLHLTGATELEFPYKTQASLQWQWQAAGDENTSAQGVPVTPPLVYMGVSEIAGNLKKLQVSTQTGAPVVLTASIIGGLVNNNNELQLAPFLQVQAQWQQQTLPVAWWVPGQPAPITNGKLLAEGNWKKYKAELQGDIYLPQAPILGVSAAAEGSFEQIRIDYLRLRERYVSTVGTMAPAINANANNSATNHSVIPTILAAPAAVINNPQIVDTDAGLSLEGSVRWLPQLDWQLYANAEHLNIASLFDNWPSNINATFSTSGAEDATGLNIQLQNLDINGDLRGVNIQGGGSIIYEGAQMRSDDLHLVLGANQLYIKGELGKQFNLDWNVNAPMLSQIDSSLRGSIISRGHLHGNAQQPQMDIEALIQQFSWGNYAVEKLQLSFAPATGAPVTAASNTTSPATTGESTEENSVADKGIAGNLAELLRNKNYVLAFSANQLRVADNRFTSVAINGTGSINTHQLQATIKHKTYGRADVKITGDYNGNEWQGLFTQLALKLKKVPRWWLTSSNKLRIAAGSLSLGRQCLTTRTNLTGQVEKIAAVEQEQVIGEWVPNQNYVKPNYEWLIKSQALPMSAVERYSLPQLCIEGEWSTGAGAQIHANLDSVPLRQFLSLFKTEVYFAGVMDGAVHISSDDLTLAHTTASAVITTRNAELRYQYVGGSTDVYAWRDFFVRATLADEKLTADAGMDWTGYGHIAASGELDLQQQTYNKGKLTAHFSNLAPLETLLPFANDVQGELRGDLSLGGSIAQPHVLGEIRLRNGSAKLPRLGIDLSNVDIQLNSSRAGTVNLVSQLQSGDGRLSIVSDLHGLGTPDWNLQGFINGNNVQIIALPQLKATLNPDIKVVATPGTLELMGTATIPWARTNIKSLPESATAVSTDVVIVDEQLLQENVKEKLNILTNLELILGDDVRFKGFGLNSKLTGKMKLFKEAQRQFFTSGFVSVVEGTYKAYGQTLTVERGRLNFQGPYENPVLDIRASRIIRDDENTKVGLDVSGTLQRPKATVFSSEKLSESQAMMMLLTGKPLDEASKADASLLISAMSGLGMDSDGSITTEITRIFHVDELEIKSDQGFNQSELWVGKYLTPKLLVRYVVGIFDQAFGFGVEYQLTNRLRLEAVSGETQSVDVVYKVEK